MKCAVAQQNIALLVYGELADDARHQLENHLADCSTCREEHEGVQALYRVMAISPLEEPSPNLLARARMQLEEALDSMPNRGWVSRITQLLITGMGRLQAAPAMASAVLLLGLGLGGFGGYEAALRMQTGVMSNQPAAPPVTEPIPDTDLSEVTGVSNIVHQPNSEIVDVYYNSIVPQTMHGSLDDPAIRRLLLVGAQSRLDNGIRDNIVGLLAAECQAGHQCGDGPIRDALLVALQYDKSPSVRLKALTGLQPYVDQDMKVRDAVLKSITSDRDAGVRIQAISMLTPVQGDSSVRGVLHSVAAQDANPRIRTVSQQVLDRLPETQ